MRGLGRWLIEPERLAGVHNVFHISHLRKCLHESAEVVEPSILKKGEVEREAMVRRVPTHILGIEVKKLRNHEVKLVKVQWSDVEMRLLGRLRTRYAQPALIFLRVHS